MKNRDQLIEEKVRLEKQLKEVNQQLKDLDNPPISVLGLSRRAENLLGRADIRTIEDFYKALELIRNRKDEVRKTKSKLKEVRMLQKGIGKETANEIITKLEEYQTKQ